MCMGDCISIFFPLGAAFMCGLPLSGAWLGGSLYVWGCLPFPLPSGIIIYDTEETNHKQSTNQSTVMTIVVTSILAVLGFILLCAATLVVGLLCSKYIFLFLGFLLLCGIAWFIAGPPAAIIVGILLIFLWC